MAKKFNGYEKAKERASYTGSEQLPPGAYICEIIGAKERDDESAIDMQFEIFEGEFKGFFKKQYDANTSEDKKHKGKVVIWQPKDDGSERDEWTKTAMMRYVNALEDSNNGYTWDWDERKWKGKKIGLIFRIVRKGINGKNVEYTEVSRPCSVEQVKNDTWYKKAADPYTYDSYNKANKPAPVDENGFMSIPEGTEEELPFA